MSINIAPKSSDTELSELIRNITAGKMQLPEFQRSWTWDDGRIRGILASLSQGFPMWAVMCLEYGNKEVKFKYRPIEGVKNVTEIPDHLVLDGQQRLTSMYRATCSKEPVETKTEKGKKIKRFYYLDMKKCLDENEDRYDAIIPVPEDKCVKKNFNREIVLDLSTRELEYEHDAIKGKQSLDKSRTVSAAYFSAARLVSLQTRNSAAYKGIMALVYREKCRDFVQGTTMDIVKSMDESPDIHHIFPESYCKKLDYPKERWNSIINKTPLLPESNRQIGGDAPSKYCQKIMKEAQIEEAQLKARVESHLINFQAFINDDFETYFIDRAKAIMSVIEAAMGKTISDKGAEQTIHIYGVSLEDEKSD